MIGAQSTRRHGRVKGLVRYSTPYPAKQAPHAPQRPRYPIRQAPFVINLGTQPYTPHPQRYARYYVSVGWLSAY